jgi:hypothetical protein
MISPIMACSCCRRVYFISTAGESRITHFDIVIDLDVGLQSSVGYVVHESSQHEVLEVYATQPVNARIARCF